MMNEAFKVIRGTLSLARQKIQDHVNEICSNGGVEYIGLGSTLDQIDRVVKELDDVCEWTEDSDGVYETGCDKLFILNDGSPEENEISYCPFCGKRLIVKEG